MKDRVWTTLQTGKRYERAAMKSMPGEMDFAIEVFARGAQRRQGPHIPIRSKPRRAVVVDRDAPRNNPRDYRKEDSIGFVPRPGKLIDPSPHEIKRTSSRRLKERGSIVVCWRSHDNADSIGSLSGVH